MGNCARSIGFGRRLSRECRSHGTFAERRSVEKARHELQPANRIIVEHSCFEFGATRFSSSHEISRGKIHLVPNDAYAPDTVSIWPDARLAPAGGSHARGVDGSRVVV
jgi:hypothetical protein